MALSPSPQQYCDQFAAALAAGTMTCVEDFLAAHSGLIDDETLERLIASEIDHRLEAGDAVSESKLVERFPNRKALVAEVFEEARARHFQQKKRLIPDPRKTTQDMMLEVFFRSTNVICPENYVELEEELESEPLPAEVRLRIIKGPHAGREVTYTEAASVLVGRGDDAKLALTDDHRCSRLHCRFEIAPPACSVVDLKSTNGTLVNGRRVDRADLKDQDTVQVGTSRIRIHIQSGTSASVEPPPTATYNPMLDAPDISGYDIEHQIGHGRFGVVYGGVERLTGRPVAIKLLCDTAVPGNDEIQQFIHEASVSVKLKHPNIVETIDFGMQDGAPYLVLERVPTINIRDHFQDLQLPQRCLTAADLTARMLEGLACAHRTGIVHRDIKLSNLLFFHSDRTIGVKISDFGLALKSTASYRTQQAVCGTAAYMAPEMVSDPAGASPLSDIYAAGVCLYQLLSNRRPHEAKKLTRLLFMILNEPSTPILERVPEIPRSLAVIVDKAIARKAENRFQSADDMRDALLAWIQRMRRR
ncbi:MAG: FHA domain-containing serine/threonine-protein kinase [Planctomycetaceae bacterium]